MPIFEVQYHLRSGKEITGNAIQADTLEHAATAAYAALERDYVLASHAPGHAVLIPKDSVEFINVNQLDEPSPQDRQMHP